MLTIVCALRCEAKPLITSLQLKADSLHAFPVYRNDDTRLVISGVGKINAAAATSYLQGIDSRRYQAWINVGIAGHPQEVIGKGFLANKIMDHGSGKCFYPGITTFQKLPPTRPILTVDAPMNAHENHFLYEMEASGFFFTASHFSSVECIHCYKVVSDNCEYPPHSLRAGIVEQLIEDSLPEINGLLLQLRILSGELEVIHHCSYEIKPFCERWHFTSTQSKQLERLLKKWETCMIHQQLWNANLKGLKNARDVLKYLEEEIKKPQNFGFS